MARNAVLARLLADAWDALPDGTPMADGFNAMADTLAAAGVRVTGDAGLDVERLARALRSVAYGGYEAEMADPMEVGDLSLNGYAKARDLAADIVRAYAATTQPECAGGVYGTCPCTCHRPAQPEPDGEEER